MALGVYHADNGDCPALKVADGALDDDGNDTDTIVVFSDGRAGSGLDGPVDLRRNVKRSDKTGGWTP